jgi:2-hydroxy-palmitic acid dioxygenase Mpo1-like
MNASTEVVRGLTFAEELKEQRWDDHRFYHQSRVNQTLHLFSASCFLVSYVVIFFNPIAAALLGWVVAMWSRQIGHFFFEPKGFDRVNSVTFEHKEAVKVGYNLQRKVILFIVWLSLPIVLWRDPTFLGFFSLSDGRSYFDRLGILWWILAFAGLLARTGWLCATRNVQTGMVWFTKILTDPFHDVKMYHKAPLFLLKGQWLDPMDDVRDAH